MSRERLKLCGICGFEVGVSYAHVTITSEDVRYKALLVCALCFQDATVESVQRNTTWSSMTLRIPRGA